MKQIIILDGEEMMIETGYESGAEWLQDQERVGRVLEFGRNKMSRYPADLLEGETL